MSINLWRTRDGNLQQKSVETPQAVEAAKADGWKTTEEMWPQGKPELVKEKAK